MRVSLVMPRRLPHSWAYSRSTGSGSSRMASSAASRKPALRNMSATSCLLYCTATTLLTEEPLCPRPALRARRPLCLCRSRRVRICDAVLFAAKRPGQGLARSAVRDDPEIAARVHHMILPACRRHRTSFQKILDQRCCHSHTFDPRSFRVKAGQRGLPGLSCPGAANRRHARSLIGHNIFGSPMLSKPGAETVGTHATVGSDVTNEN
jgi:hypothetical protein